MNVVCYCSVHHGKQMAPGETDPLPVGRSSAGGETLEETAAPIDACRLIARGLGSSAVPCVQAWLRKPCIREATL